MRPRVSIIMPARNAERFIIEAVHSVLAECMTSLEVVVVDDGSTDGTVARVEPIIKRDHRVRMIPGPQNGVAAAVNAGFSAARGEIFMRCDADDRYAEGRIRRQVATLDRWPHFDAICGHYATILRSGKLLIDLPTGDHPQEITEELRQADVRTHWCTWAFRAEAWHAIGGLREWFETAEDLDVQLRLAGAGRVWYDPEPAYFYRLHEDSLTHRQPNNRRIFYHKQALAFAAQRRATGRDDLERGAAPEPPCEEDAAGRMQRQAQGQLLGYAWREHKDGHHLAAVRAGVRSLALDVMNIRAWRNVAALIVKRAPVPLDAGRAAPSIPAAE